MWGPALAGPSRAAGDSNSRDGRLRSGTAALAIGAFSLGRVWDAAPARSTDSVADVTDISERLLRSEVEEYLERSQRVLVQPGELR